MARYMREDTLRIPGWSVGYSPEISAHAAVRTPAGKRDWLFVMTSPEDREPESLDEEVSVGLYEFDGDDWNQIGYEDFDTVSDVIRMSDAELERAVRGESRDVRTGPLRRR